MKTNFNDPADKIAEGMIKEFINFSHSGWDEEYGWDEDERKKNAYKCALLHVQGLINLEQTKPTVELNLSGFSGGGNPRSHTPILTKLQEVEKYLMDKLK